METKIKGCDALGAEIKLNDKRYGYARNQNGFNIIVTGLAVKLHDSGKVTLKLLSRSEGLYDNMDYTNIVKAGETVIVKSMMLFPV